MTDHTIIHICNEIVVLSMLKAIYLPKRDALIVADVHLGKVSHFRKAGIGIPAKAAHADIHSLQNLLAKFPASHIIFLGDLFHSEYNDFVQEFQQFRVSHPKKIFTLVQGNHDVMEAVIYRDLNIDVVDSLQYGNIFLTHELTSVPNENVYNIAGHIHPGIKLKGKANQSVKLPCFHFTKSYGILPAFGYFTGLSAIKTSKDALVFGILDHAIIDVNPQKSYAIGHSNNISI